MSIAATFFHNAFAQLRRSRLLSSRRRRIDRWLQQGYRMQRAGTLSGAQRLYERVLQVDPDNADAHYLLGALLGHRSELFPAVAHLARATTLDPSFAEPHLALGNVYLLLGNKQCALMNYQRAAELLPENAAAHANLGLLLQGEGKREQAIGHFLRALKAEPKLPDLLKNLTLAYIESAQLEEALKTVDDALQREPEDLQALSCKGFVLQKMQEPSQARAYYEKALALGGGDAELLNNLAIVLQDLGHLDEAIARYDEAILLKPDFPLAIWHRSLAYLLRHEFKRAWPDYELRMLSTDAARVESPFPNWSGRSGAAVLVRAEQGIGDQIMFASCIPDLIATSSRCVVECAPKLKSLFQRSFAEAAVYSTDEPIQLAEGIKTAAVDAQIMFGSLPLHFRPSVGSFPKHAGYLRADPQSTQAWQKRLAMLGPDIKVGISWQGGTQKTRKEIRSVPLQRLAPILQIAGARFINLQHTECDAEIRECEATLGVSIENWRDAHESFDETAALVSALDLIISVCSAVIHLSGALGKAVWILAPYSPEWRYGIAGTSMPWYPSARLFRQPEYGAWDAVIANVAAALRDRIDGDLDAR
jgi:tetratricopeptide (TPR) repeat protein